MSKAKIASKAKKGIIILFKGQEVIPVKFVSEVKSFMAAEYKTSGDLVIDDNSEILKWAEVRSLSEIKQI